MLKSMKFHVESPEQSAIVQRVLIALGYHWVTYNTPPAPMYTEYPYLYANGVNCALSYGTDKENFESSGNQKVALSGIVEAVTRKPPLCLRPKWIVAEARAAEINQAIQQYIEAKTEIPQDWVEELNECLRLSKLR